MHRVINNVDVFNVMQESVRAQMTQNYLKINFCRLNFQICINLTRSLSLSKGIKKATSLFHAALFACEEAARKENIAMFPSASSGTKKLPSIIFKIHQRNPCGERSRTMRSKRLDFLPLIHTNLR
jgi:hypothetical protein